jgi:outer membrane protein assembly factor BamB
MNTATRHLLLALPSLAISLHAANWPAWRGASGNGTCNEGNLPEKWSATENVRWKVVLPGPGNSTPVVWADRIFLTQARASDGGRGVICLDRSDGRVLWERWIEWKSQEPSHETNPPCSASPATDGERIVAMLGSPGLFCWAPDGRELWRRDFGKLEHEWGYGASPVIDDGRVILNFGPGARSFLGAFDLKSGEPLWRVDIPEEKPKDRTDGFQGRETEGVVGSWATPIVVAAYGRREVIFPFNSRLRGFDAKTGAELWTCGGLTPLFYASPVADSAGTVFLASGYRGNAVAVRTGGSGDVTASRRLWHEEGAKSGIGSGLIHEGKIYYHAASLGICRDLKTGETLWEERLRGAESNVDSWSSLMRAGDRIYVPNQSGDVIIFRSSPKFELIGVNSIGGERCNASLAATGNHLLLRTHKHLWCLGK